MQFGSALTIAVSFITLFSKHVAAEAVFAHYMVGNTLPEHIHKDVDDAVAMGLDGFALNIGAPEASFVSNTLNTMFDYIEGVPNEKFRYPNFKLFISMDISASGGGPGNFTELVKAYKSRGAYQTGLYNRPMVSTFSGGSSNKEWSDWRKTDMQDDVFLIPDFDSTQGYYQAASEWWSYWGNVTDGLFSWESAWPSVDGSAGRRSSGDVSLDKTVMEGVGRAGKTYMAPLSPLQYKNAYGANVYRPGDDNLPLRMIGILDNMSPSPEYVEILTWNDGPESHYVGNIWPEQNTDRAPAAYASQASAPHTGWQPLLGAFIQAFKAGQRSHQMRPHSSSNNNNNTTQQQFSGALWYKTILSSADCGSGAEKPKGFELAKDTLNYAIVMAPQDDAAEGQRYFARLYSGGALVQTAALGQGLNHGAAPAALGAQRLEVVDAAGRVQQAAAGGACVGAGCPDGFYNMNPQVMPLAPAPAADAGKREGGGAGREARCLGAAAATGGYAEASRAVRRRSARRRVGGNAGAVARGDDGNNNDIEEDSV